MMIRLIVEVDTIDREHQLAYVCTSMIFPICPSIGDTISIANGRSPWEESLDLKVAEREFCTYVVDENNCMLVVLICKDMEIENAKNDGDCVSKGHGFDLKKAEDFGWIGEPWYMAYSDLGYKSLNAK